MIPKQYLLGLTKARKTWEENATVGTMTDFHSYKGLIAYLFYEKEVTQRFNEEVSSLGAPLPTMPTPILSEQGLPRQNLGFVMIQRITVSPMQAISSLTRAEPTESGSETIEMSVYSPRSREAVVLQGSSPGALVPSNPQNHHWDPKLSFIISSLRDTSE